MIDVKKLITGFLILATAVISSGILLSFVGNAAPETAAPSSGIALNEGTSSLGANAFLPDEQSQNLFDVVSTSTVAGATSSDPDNVTVALANSFMNGVDASNPNGAATDTSGNLSLRSPDVTSVAAELGNATAMLNLKIPDWDFEAKSQPINIVSSSNAASISQYAVAANDALSGHFDAQTESILSNETDNADLGNLGYVLTKVRGTLGDILALQVPAPMVKYHKSLVRLLVYEKNALQLVSMAAVDPAKASIIMNGEEQGFNSADADFQTQAQNIKNEGLIPQTSQATPKNNVSALVDNFLGIKTAYALWPVFDPATWSLIEANEGHLIAHELWVEVKNTLLQILKNTLIALLQKTALKWLQGNGVPRFVQQFGANLIGQAQNYMIQSINSKMSCGVYPAFIGSERLIIGSGLFKQGNNQCANQFQTALSSQGKTLGQFYNNFSNGGFVVWGASQMPSGNVYGDTFFNAQIVGSNVQTSQQANQTKVAAGGGFKGDQKCDDGSDPSGQETDCVSTAPEGGADYFIPAGGGFLCGPGYNPVVIPNGGVCDDGTEPIVNTPSSMTAFTLGNVSGATTQQIASANAIVGVLNAVLSSFMNSLMSAAINKAGQFVNNGLQGGVNSLNPNLIVATSTPPGQKQLACAPVTQTLYYTATTTMPANLSASGGTYNSNQSSSDYGLPPNYIWTPSVGATSTGETFTETFNFPGFYTVMLTDDAVPADLPATCTVTVQLSQ